MDPPLGRRRRGGPRPGLRAVFLAGLVACAVLAATILALLSPPGRERAGPGAPAARTTPADGESPAVRYSVAWSRKLPLGAVWAVTALGPDLWIVGGDEALVLVSRSGVMGRFELGGASTCLAAALPVDGSQEATVSVYAGVRDRLEILSVQGTAIARIGSSPSFGQDAELVSVAVLGDRICVADAWSGVVFVCSTAGALEGLFGKDQFLLPSPHLDLAPAGEREVWVAHAGRFRLELWSVSGRLEQFWGTSAPTGAGFAGCCNPTHIATLPDGRLVAAEKGTVRARLFEADGTLVGVVVPEGWLAPGASIADLAVDAAGRVAIVEDKGCTLYVFESAEAR